MQILQCPNNRGGNQRVRRFLNSFLFFPLTFLDEVIGWWSSKIQQQVLHWGKFWVLDLLSKRREPFGYWSNNLHNNIRQGPTNMSILSTREIIKTTQKTLKESSYIRRDQTHNFRIHILRMISILWKSTKSDEEIAKKSMGEESSKPKPNCAPAARERERESEREREFPTETHAPQ